MARPRRGAPELRRLGKGPERPSPQGRDRFYKGKNILFVRSRGTDIQRVPHRGQSKREGCHRGGKRPGKPREGRAPRPQGGHGVPAGWRPAVPGSGWLGRPREGGGTERSKNSCVTGPRRPGAYMWARARFGDAGASVCGARPGPGLSPRGAPRGPAPLLAAASTERFPFTALELEITHGKWCRLMAQGFQK